MAQTLELHIDHTTCHDTVFDSSSAPMPRIVEVRDSLDREAKPTSSAYRIEKRVPGVFQLRAGAASAGKMSRESDYIDLVCLEHDGDTARAPAECTASLVPKDHLVFLAEGDAERKQKNDAIKRDFEFGKALADHRGRAHPIERVAAFLIAVSRQNAIEGRDQSVVSDSLECGTVASLLGLDINKLASCLFELKQRGLVEEGPASRLHLKDLEALEVVAKGSHRDVGLFFEGMPALAAIPLKVTGASTLASWKFADPPGADFWRVELVEAAWLVAFVGGLSAFGVGLAVMMAIALAL